MNTPHNPQDIEQLIGGYAAGILSAAERQALFDAALHNQALFNVLADEEALRAALADPATRSRLLAVLGSRPQSAWGRFTAWVFRPAPIAAASLAAVALVVTVVVVREPQPPAPVAQLAQREMPPPGPAAVPTAEPAPKPAREPAGLLAKRKDGAQTRVHAPPTPLQSAASPQEALTTERRAAAETFRDSASGERARLAASPVSEPFRYAVQRRQADGTWVEFNGELSAGDAVRIAIAPGQSGSLQATLEGQLLFSGAITVGQDMFIPPSGALPSTAGIRALMLSFQPYPPPAPKARDDRAPQIASQRASGYTLTPYSVTIRLAYR